jgi:hypothetical protein
VIKPLPPADLVRRLLTMKEDGTLVWAVNRGAAKVGHEAGRINKDGYRDLQISKRTIPAHRIVWLFSRGEWPTKQIDHIDRNRLNNAPSNLREADHSENQCNSKKLSAVGLRGVVLHKKSGRYQAQIGKKYLGLFDTQEAASAAYDKAAASSYGEFASLNKEPK